MNLYCSLLFLIASQAVHCVYYYPDSLYQQCTNIGPAKFGFPSTVGDITGHTGPIAPSGLAHSRRFNDVLYFVNDESGANIVHAINALNAKVIGSITITDATNVEWEDVTVGHCPAGLSGSCIYVQDAGDDEPGPAHVLYVVQEEEEPGRDINKPADKIIRYQFQPGVTVEKSNGLFVDCQGNIFFFDAASGGQGARLFQLKESDGQYTAEGLLQLDLPTTDDGPVALSLSADCCELLIKMEDKVYYIPITNGQFDIRRLQLLPYVPNDDEEAITWTPQQDGYYTVSEDKPFTLKLAQRNRDVPDPKFSLGRLVGTIDDKRLERIVGLAGSRLHRGFVYAVSRDNLDEVLILQIFQAQTTGVIKLGIGAVIVLDMATGPCPPRFSVSSCIFINTVMSGQSTVIVLEEPSYPFAKTSQTTDVLDMIKYTLPSHETPRAIMIGPSSEIYIMNYIDDDDEKVTVYKLLMETNSPSAVPIANFTSPSIEDGPLAAAVSPCFKDMLIKFEDIVLFFDIRYKNMDEAFGGIPTILPYIPEENGQSIAFSSCDNYLTASSRSQPVPLMIYSRL